MAAPSLRRLEYFLVVAEELSFTHAARRLHMAQPPLSQQIKKLERELECELFVRTSRGLRLTPAGVALLQGASSLLGEADRVGLRVRAAATGESGFLTIGCVPVACEFVAPLLVRRFHRSYPDVQLLIRELDTVALYNSLSTRDTDVGIVRTGVDAPGMRTMELLDEAALVALPDDHELVSRDRLALADLEHEDFVLFSRKLGMRHFDEFVRACREVGGFSPHIVSERESVSAQLAMIGAGLGVGFVTELSARVETPGVVYRAVRDLDMRIPMILAWPDHHADPVRSLFVEVATQWRSSAF
ncbi:MAG: LysR substrate-binding domain-containing protein [Nocardioidaceae bacterium]